MIQKIQITQKCRPVRSPQSKVAKPARSFSKHKHHHKKKFSNTNNHRACKKSAKFHRTHLTMTTAWRIILGSPRAPEVICTIIRTRVSSPLIKLRFRSVVSINHMDPLVLQPFIIARHQSFSLPATWTCKIKLALVRNRPCRILVKPEIIWLAKIEQCRQQQWLVMALNLQDFDSNSTFKAVEAHIE